MGSVSSIEDLRSDPERISRSARSERHELALLASLRTIAVPAGAKATVWSALGVQVAAVGVVGTGASSSSWTASFWRAALNALAGSKSAVAAVPIVIVALGAGA